MELDVVSLGNSQAIHKPPTLMSIHSAPTRTLRFMNGLGDEALRWAAVKEPRGHGFFMVSNGVCEWGEVFVRACACVRRSCWFPLRNEWAWRHIANKPHTREHKHIHAESISGEGSEMWANKHTCERDKNSGADQRAEMRGRRCRSACDYFGAWTWEFPQELWWVFVAISGCMCNRKRESVQQNVWVCLWMKMTDSWVE